MTLIAIVFEQNGPCIAISDLALSQDDESVRKLNLEDFPFQFLKGRSAAQLGGFEPGAIVSFERKIVQFDNHMILWSGRWIYAFSCIKHLYDNRGILNVKNVDELCREAVEDHVDDLSLIYCHIHDGATDIWRHNCQQTSYGSVNVVVGGSGAYRFVDEFNKTADFNVVNTAFRHGIARLSHVIEAEIGDPQAYWHGIGGSYEIHAFRNSEWVGVPYSVIIYTGDKENFGMGGMLHFAYFEGHFSIIAIDPTCVVHSADDWKYLMITGFDSANHTIVPDFLRRNMKVLTGPPELGVGESILKMQQPQELNIIILAKFSENSEYAAVETWFNRPPWVDLTFARAESSEKSSEKDLKLSGKFPAKFSREVEEFFLERPFIPPDDVKHIYE